MNVSDRTPDDAPAALAGRLDALLSRAVSRRRHVRHGLLAVASDDGTWAWFGAHGVADETGTPVTTETRYPIASVTKLFTAAVTLRLVEQDRLDLRDRMVDLLPTEITAGLHVLDGQDRTDQVTVEHLLGHTAGLADYYEDAPRGGRSAQAALTAPRRIPTCHGRVRHPSRRCRCGPGRPCCSRPVR